MWPLFLDLLLRDPGRGGWKYEGLSMFLLYTEMYEEGSILCCPKGIERLLLLHKLHSARLRSAHDLSLIKQCGHN